MSKYSKELSQFLWRLFKFRNPHTLISDVPPPQQENALCPPNFFLL